MAIPDGLFVREARLDGRPVSLVEGPLARVVPRLTFCCRSWGGRRSAWRWRCPCPPRRGPRPSPSRLSSAALSRATLSLPRQSRSPACRGLLGRKTEAGEACASWPTAGPVSRWPFPGGASARNAGCPAAALSRQRHRIVGLNEDAAQVNATVRLEVIQGAAASASVALPEGFVVNEVSGAAVGTGSRRAGTSWSSSWSPPNARPLSW